MISVYAIRAPGDKQGPDISSTLMTSEHVALERGRNEIDASFTNRELVSSSGPYQGFVTPGALAEIADSERQSWRGKVISSSIDISIDGQEFSAISNLTTEREIG